MYTYIHIYIYIYIYIYRLIHIHACVCIHICIHTAYSPYYTPPLKSIWGCFGLMLQTWQGNIYFTELADRVEYGKYVQMMSGAWGRRSPRPGSRAAPQRKQGSRESKGELCVSMLYHIIIITIITVYIYIYMYISCYSI